MNTDTGALRRVEQLQKLLAKEMLVENKNLPRKARNELAATGASKIGRNAKCPCGSGLKFKRCHYTGA